MKLWMAVPLLLNAPDASGIEARDLQGLQITFDQWADPVQVDGVAMRIQRAAGGDVDELARRIVARWRREGDVVRPLQRPGWQLVARWREGRSELLQWRGEGADGELLHSSLDLMRGTSRAPPPPFALPARCRWGRSIEGGGDSRPFQQRSAYCTSSLPGVQPLIRSQLTAQGWSVSPSGKPVMELEHTDIRGRLILSEDGPAGTALVWIATFVPGAAH